MVGRPTAGARLDRWTVHAVAAVLLIATALASCGGDSDADSATNAAATDVAATPTVPPQTASPTPAPAASPAATPAPTRTAVAGCPQGPSAPPATYYGFGLDPGDVVTSLNTRPGCEVVCEQAVVDSDALWVLRIAGDNVCGVREGDVIEFTVNGEPVTPTETWAPGGAPADAAQGITLR